MGDRKVLLGGGVLTLPLVGADGRFEGGEGESAPPVTNPPPARSHLLMLALSVVHIRRKKLFEADLNLDFRLRHFLNSV